MREISESRSFFLVTIAFSSGDRPLVLTGAFLAAVEAEPLVGKSRI